MSGIYKSEDIHSIIFKKESIDKDGAVVVLEENARNTWDYWHLIPASRSVIQEPARIYKYIDIPGRDGPLDATDYLIGRPLKQQITGSFTFYIYDFYVENQVKTWLDQKASLAEFFDGSVMRVYLEAAGKNAAYEYRGRCCLKDWKPDASHSQVTIEYNLEPNMVPTLFPIKPENGGGETIDFGG